MGLSIKRLFLILLVLIVASIASAGMLQSIIGYSSTGVSLGPPTNVASAPTGSTTTSITVTWTKSANATNYDIKYGTSTGTYTTTVSNVGDVSTYDITGLTFCTNYFIVVVAKLNGATSTSSETSSYDALACDTFTGSDSTTLASHTGNVGVTWVADSNWGAQTLTIQTNRASDSQDTATWGTYYDSAWTPPSADYSVSVDCYVSGTANANDQCGVHARSSTSALTNYDYQCANGTCTLYSIVAGTPAQIGDGYVYTSWASGQTHTLKIKVSGTTIKGYVDGTERATGTNSDISAAGVAGFGITGTHFKADNFFVTVP